MTHENTQQAALDWLVKHNSDGTLDRHGVVLAAGESAPFRRSTWNALARAGRVEFYRLSPRGYGRIRVTPTQGRAR